MPDPNVEWDPLTNEFLNSANNQPVTPDSTDSVTIGADAGDAWSAGYAMTLPTTLNCMSLTIQDGVRVTLPSGATLNDNVQIKRHQHRAGSDGSSHLPPHRIATPRRAAGRRLAGRVLISTPATALISRTAAGRSRCIRNSPHAGGTPRIFGKPWPAPGWSSAVPSLMPRGNWSVPVRQSSRRRQAPPDPAGRDQQPANCSYV
jgi:hypothetical protein